MPSQPRRSYQDDSLLGYRFRIPKTQKQPCFLFAFHLSFNQQHSNRHVYWCCCSHLHRGSSIVESRDTTEPEAHYRKTSQKKSSVFEQCVCVSAFRISQKFSFIRMDIYIYIHTHCGDRKRDTTKSLKTDVGCWFSG